MRADNASSLYINHTREVLMKNNDTLLMTLMSSSKKYVSYVLWMQGINFLGNIIIYVYDKLKNRIWTKNNVSLLSLKYDLCYINKTKVSNVELI